MTKEIKREVCLDSEFIKYLLSRKHLTQEQFAKELSIAQNNVARWLNHTVEPKMTSLVKIAKLLDVSVEEIVLIGDQPSRTESPPFLEGEFDQDISERSSISKAPNSETQLIVQPRVSASGVKMPVNHPAIDGMLDFSNDFEVLKCGIQDEKAFSVFVEDEHLLPDIPKNSYVIISPWQSFKSGLLAAIVTNTDDLLLGTIYEIEENFIVVRKGNGQEPKFIKKKNVKIINNKLAVWSIIAVFFVNPPVLKGDE